MELSEADRKTLQVVDEFIVEAVAELELADDETVAQMQIEWDHLLQRLLYPTP